LQSPAGFGFAYSSALIMPCCFPDCARRTFPVAVKENRFFALLFDLSFGMGYLNSDYEMLL